MPLPLSLPELLHGNTVEWERLELNKGWNPAAVMVRLPVHPAALEVVQQKPRPESQPEVAARVAARVTARVGAGIRLVESSLKRTSESC